MLHTFEYQNIVDRVIGILGKNINIMDTSGIIIASGDETRIGIFHEIAALSALENREIIVDEENALGFAGVKPGINLPVYFGNRVIGVVGITGKPSEVAGYGKIIKELVELMVHDKHQKRLEQFQHRAISGLVIELVKKPLLDEDEIRILENRATLARFDLEKKRVLIIADIKNFGEFISKKSLSEVQIQELKQSVLDLILVGNNSHDVAFNLDRDRFMILKTDIDSIENYCLNKHLRIKNNLGINLIFAQGETCSSLKDYNAAYEKALHYVEIANKLDDVYFLSDSHFDLHLLAFGIQDKFKKDYVKHFHSILAEDNINMLQTAKAFFESGMNSKESAAKLYIHKNTLLYRLNKIKELYGIDPFNPFQCMKLYLASIIRDVSK